VAVSEHDQPKPDVPLVFTTEGAGRDDPPPAVVVTGEGAGRVDDRPTTAVTDYDQLSLGDLKRRLTYTTSELTRKQIELAKQEGREDLRQTIRAAIWLGIGAALMLFAVVCLLIALTSATSALTPLPLWGSALIWLVIFAAIGAFCLLHGKGQIQTRPLGYTRATLKEDLEWVKQRLKPQGR
jgi:uncharacterized membrane protein YqjE